MRRLHGLDEIRIMKTIDLSSWVSWCCYAVGVSFEIQENTLVDPVSLDVAIFIMVVAIAVFFAIVISIQRYMRVSIRAVSFGAPRQLISAGPFLWSRNPIYLAFLIPLVALTWVSAGAAACTIGLYIAAMNTLVITYEERDLSEPFGDQYEEYRRRTPRWLFL